MIERLRGSAARLLLAGSILAAPIAAWSADDFDIRSQIGPHPVLPVPQQYLVPPMHLAAAVPWKPGQMPTVGPDLKIESFAPGLEHPRSVYNLPNGDVLVVEILRFPYTTGQTSISAAPTVLTPLPGGPIDHHWTKSLVASDDGTRLYVGVGSNSNITENGMAAELDRGCIWVVDRASGAHRIFASGLRNPNGLSFEPQTHALWAVVNERDELGPNLVPDYMTSVRDGAFYGWPYSYYGQHLDPRVKPQRPDLVAKAIPPDYALSSHVAPLGMVFDTANGLPPRFRSGAFVGEHGSWDRPALNGYKVVFIPFRNGMPSGTTEDVVTGFLDSSNQAHGRPVGLTLDKAGALLIADDVGNTVWRVTSATQKQASAAPLMGRAGKTWSGTRR